EVKDGILVPLFQNVKFTRLELNLFQSFKLPWWKHSLAFKLRGGTLLGPQVDDFFDFYLGGLIGMKGYPFYSISGNEIAHINLSYIFPIAQNIDAKLGHIYIDKIFGMIYGDFGNAWNGREVKLKDFKKGIGTELRIQMNSFYIFPTSVFFNISYSFDKFQRVNAFTKELIDYGREVKLYFGVLFGFDF
ncbi:MAG: biopolymer transporter Tol, partial [Ignavibacteria bacterium]|nr:biopolymer transporter Tol [Ignavibacteria bacterium]